jgi:hypothetical protein
MWRGGDEIREVGLRFRHGFCYSFGGVEEKCSLLVRYTSHLFDSRFSLVDIFSSELKDYLIKRLMS